MKKEIVYRGIFDDIILGVYPANTILNEHVLVEKYGVSKTSVREALIELCNEGILKNIPRYGYQVPVIIPAEINEMIDYRIILELSSLEKVIENITDADIKELIQHINTTEKIVEQKNISVHWMKNMEFHLMLCQYCGNRYIYKSLKGVLKFLARASRQYFEKSWENNVKTDTRNHRNLVCAIQERNLELANTLLRKDIESMRGRIFGFE